MIDSNQIIYKKIGNILWSIFPKQDDEIFLQGQVYEHQDFQLSRRCNSYIETIDIPPDIFLELIELLSDLKNNEIFSGECWTQFKISLTNEGKFKIEFAYIPQEDSWPGLYMRGVGDLTEYEADHVYYVPKEIWAERVKQKTQEPPKNK